MLPLLFKGLGDGLLPTPTKAVLYTVPAGMVTVVRSILVTNKSGALRTVNIYANRQGVSRSICPNNLQLKTDYYFELDEAITLEAGDSIEADSDATNVTYVLNGGEETL